MAKILPNLGGPDVDGYIRAEQEAAIQRMMAESTRAILQASDTGIGKTLIATEFALRMGFERVLYIGVKDTFKQWADRLLAQSDGAVRLRRLDATKVGRAAFDDFVAGKPGHYFSGSQYLVAQDWEHRPVRDHEGRQVWKVLKSTKEMVLKAPRLVDAFLAAPVGEIGPQIIPVKAPMIGPQLLPTRLTERYQLGTYKKMKPLDLIVFDEVHVIANRKSVGRKTIVSIKSDWKVGMSGTFVGNKFENAWSITRWLWNSLVDGSFIRWREDWCSTEEVYVKGGEAKTRVTGERTPGLFVSTLPCYIRAEGEPAPDPRLVYVALTEAQRAQYDELEADLLVWLDSHGGGVAPLVADLPIVLRSRLRTATLGELAFDEAGDVAFDLECRSSKLHALRGVLDGWGDQPAVIYTDSKRFAKVVVARMKRAGYATAEWSGDVTSTGRDEIKRQFLAGEVRYIVAVIPAFSTGLDGFQSVCSKVVWLSESENEMLNTQAIARIWRQGMTTQYGAFEHVKILAVDTYDVGVFGRLVAQRLNMAATLRLAA